MFGTIRKHQKWLWGVIITLTIISFVIFFSPYSKMNDTRRVKVDLGSIYGHRVSEEAFVNARREVYVRYLVTSGHWPDEQAQQNVDRETYEWMFLGRKQEMTGIHINKDRVADLAREMIGSLQRVGINSPTDLDKVLEAQGFSMEDFERFVDHYLGLQEMVATIGVSGKLATPDEIKSLYIREHQELATEGLFFNASNYMASVTVTPDAVQQFYTNDLANYRIPERAQVSYIEFSVSNFLGQAEEFMAKTNLSEMVEANYQRFGTNLFRDAKTPEEAKKKIREEIIREQALGYARRKANEFARPLFDVQKPSVDALMTAAASAGLTVQVSEPFTREAPPKALEVNEDFVKGTFRLSPEDPLGGPYRGQDGIYIIAFNKRLPSEVPSLDLIRDRVVADYRYEQAKTMARQAGLGFYPTLTNGLAQGKTFEALCAEAKLRPLPLPQFSISTRSLPELEEQVSLNLLKQLAFTTSPGKASGFQWTAQGGVVLYVKAKLPIDEARMKTDLPSYISAVRQQRQQEAFQVWFQQEYTRNVRALLAQPQQAQPPPNLSSRGAKKS